MDIAVFIVCVMALAIFIFMSAWSKRHKVEISTRTSHIAYAVLSKFKEHARFAHFKLHEGFTDVEYEQAIDELNQKIPLNEVKSSDTRLRRQHRPYYPPHYTRSSEEGD